MSKLYKVVDGFDAISGAAFGGGGGGGGGGGKKWKNPIRSHPSAMTSAQYNNAYGNGNRDKSNCADVAIIGALAGGGKSIASSVRSGSIPTPGSVAKGALVAGAGAGIACVISGR